jgi:hypothetical protein
MAITYSCDYDLLCTWDELRNQMTEGTVFRGFQEGRIQFPPSYKYDVGTKGELHDQGTLNG